MKTSLILLALAFVALLAGLVVIGWRSDEPVGAGGAGTSGSPSFEVHVVRPRSARPLFGLLPHELEAMLVEDIDLGFDSASRGAAIGGVGHDRLELSADGWELSVETDGEGRVAPGTHLVLPVVLADKQRRLRCRPADRATGNLRTSTRMGSDELDGRFLVELATCVNTETGKTLEWPPRPLTVRGSFEGLPHGRR